MIFFIRNCSEDIGNIFIEIHVTTNQGKKKKIVGVIYRPPSKVFVII